MWMHIVHGTTVCVGAMQVFFAVGCLAQAQASPATQQTRAVSARFSNPTVIRGVFFIAVFVDASHSRYFTFFFSCFSCASIAVSPSVYCTVRPSFLFCRWFWLASFWRKRCASCRRGWTRGANARSSSGKKSNICNKGEPHAGCVGSGAQRTRLRSFVFKMAVPIAHSRSFVGGGGGRLACAVCTD